MDADKVYHVQHTAVIDGAYHIAVTDLVFRSGASFAVLAWRGAPGNEYPLVSVPLDPTHLQELHSGRIDYLYDGLIEGVQKPPETPQ